jgi:hypothetical protein
MILRKLRFDNKVIIFTNLRSNDTVRIRPFTVTLRTVLSGTEIRPYHSEITGRIRLYTVKIRIAVSIDLGMH